MGKNGKKADHNRSKKWSDLWICVVILIFLIGVVIFSVFYWRPFLIKGFVDVFSNLMN